MNCTKVLPYHNIPNPLITAIIRDDSRNNLMQGGEGEGEFQILNLYFTNLYIYIYKRIYLFNFGGQGPSLKWGMILIWTRIQLTKIKILVILRIIIEWLKPIIFSNKVFEFYIFND